jgi:hypothetical protein
MKSLRLVTALGLMMGAALAVPVSTEASDRDRRSSRGHSNSRYDRRDGGGSRGYSDHRYDRRDGGRSHGHSYRSRSYGRSYGYGSRYSYSYRRPSYVYPYGYDPYYYDDYDYGYYVPPAYYTRPYYAPRVGIVVGRPRVGLYLGW